MVAVKKIVGLKICNVVMKKEGVMGKGVAFIDIKNNNIKFNIVLVDAPYKMEVMEEVIELVTKYDLLLDKGILLLEYSFDKLKDKYNNLELIKSKKYSDKYVNIYRKIID